MRNLVSRLSFLFPVAAILTLSNWGCTPTNLFSGRLFLINSTRGVIRSPVLSNSHPGLEQTFKFPDMADGQAWVRDFRGDDSLVAMGDLSFSYVDRTGAARTRVVPFLSEIPDYCHDDFFIEVDENDQLHWGLLIYRNYHENYYAVIRTHATAAATGLLLGWLIWRKRRGRTVQPGHPEKSVTPEI